MAGCGRFLYVFGAHGLVDDTNLAGAVIRETAGYEESRKRRGDGAYFKVIEDLQCRFGASVDLDSGVGVSGGHCTQK